MSKLFYRITKYYWTFIGSLIYKNKRPSEASRTVLIFKTDGLGDFFLLVPFLQNLICNNYKIVCVGNNAFKEIVNHLNLQLTFIPLTNRSYKEFKELLKTLDSFDFDYAINLSMNIWGGIIVNQSRATVKIGLVQEREHYVYKGANLFYDKVLTYEKNTHNFTILQNIFTSFLKVKPAPELISTPTNNKRYILIHTYSSWKPKIWPYYNELIHILLKENFTIHLIGTSKEHSSNNWITDFQGKHGVEIIHLESVSHLLKEVENATAFIGNDSGPAHYSALIGKPTTVIWGGALFERIHPIGIKVTYCKVDIECRPCRQKGDVCERGTTVCLNSITVNQVLSTFKNSLA